MMANTYASRISIIRIDDIFTIALSSSKMPLNTKKIYREQSKGSIQLAIHAILIQRFIALRPLRVDNVPIDAIMIVI